MRTFSSTAHLDLDYARDRGAMTMMWKAAAAFILAIGAGGFVAGSVLGDSGDPPDVGAPVVLGNDGAADQQPRGQSDPTARPTDDDGTPDQGGSNDDDDDDLDTVYHEPEDLDDDSQGRGRGRGRGGDDDRTDNSGPGSSNSGSGSDDDSGDDDDSYDD
jgi:hypothetical protein